MLIVALDEIAWFLNLRGTDIEFNPVFFSYAIFHVATKSVDLFISAEKTTQVTEYLSSINVKIKPYE
jgi:Xaa-Pro aminopeptidase